jgi:hypothetical protein
MNGVSTSTVSGQYEIHADASACGFSLLTTVWLELRRRKIGMSTWDAGCIESASTRKRPFPSQNLKTCTLSFILTKWRGKPQCDIPTIRLAAPYNTAVTIGSNYVLRHCKNSVFYTRNVFMGTTSVIEWSEFDSRRYQIFWEVVGHERSPLSLVSTTEELLERKSRGWGLKNQEYGGRDLSRWPRDTFLSANVGTNLANKRRSLGPYSSLMN